MTGRGAAVVVALVSMACSSGDDRTGTSGDADDEEVDGVDLAPTTTAPGATDPPATPPDEVAAHVEDLLARYDEALNAIVADPAVARDRDAEVVRDFLDLFEPGSDFAEGSLEGWVEMADSGTHLEPATDGEPVNVTYLDSGAAAEGDDTVRFAKCTVQRYVVVEDGEETDRRDLALLPGNGWAVRVDGQWLLRELTSPPDMVGCLRGPDGAEPGQ